MEANHGYLKLGSALLSEGIKFGEAWNFGPSTNKIIEVEKIVKIIKDKFGKGEIEYGKSEYHESQLLSLDITKSISRLNWSPVLDIDKTMSWTIDWYKTSEENPAYLETLTTKQIKDYQILI